MPNHKNVIALAKEWTFLDYADDIEVWHLELSEEGQDLFNSILKTNSKISDPRNWTSCKLLHGACRNERIWEWVFFSNDAQQRLLGVQHPTLKRTAVFLIGCSHKQRIYKPLNCLDTAVQRAKKLKQGGLQLSERKIKSDI